MHWKPAATTVLLLLMAALAAGCSSEGNASSDDERPKVLTTFTVIADMVREVGGDRVEVASITKPGSEIHGYEPTPSDLRNTTDADIVLWNGLGLERWFKQFIDEADRPSATLSEGVEPISITGETEYAGLPNPHAWMSVTNAEIYVDNIAGALARIDPENRRHYSENAERYKQEIRRLGRDVAQRLANVTPDHRLLVTCEGAFSYLARDLGLREAYIWPVNAEREGTPQQIAETVEEVERSGVPAVFCESTVSDESMRQVASDAGTEVAGTLYVDSLSEGGGPVPTYLDLLRHDVETILRGLTVGPQ